MNNKTQPKGSPVRTSGTPIGRRPSTMISFEQYKAITGFIPTAVLRGLYADRVKTAASAVSQKTVPPGTKKKRQKGASELLLVVILLIVFWTALFGFILSKIGVA